MMTALSLQAFLTLYATISGADKGFVSVTAGANERIFTVELKSGARQTFQVITHPAYGMYLELINTDTTNKTE